MWEEQCRTFVPPSLCLSIAQAGQIQLSLRKRRNPGCGLPVDVLFRIDYSVQAGLHLSFRPIDPVSDVSFCYLRHGESPLCSGAQFFGKGTMGREGRTVGVYIGFGGGGCGRRNARSGRISVQKSKNMEKKRKKRGDSVGSPTSWDTWWNMSVRWRFRIFNRSKYQTT